jgi:hypothetical protein
LAVVGRRATARAYRLRPSRRVHRPADVAAAGQHVADDAAAGGDDLAVHHVDGGYETYS